MKIKLYYKNYPGETLTDSSDELMIWGGYNASTFHHILDAVGVDYEWSNDPKNSLVVLDIGSSNFQSDREKLLGLCDRFTDEYGKFLLFTSQEPINKEHIDYLLKEYPNMYIMDIKDKDTDNNYIPFPSFFVRIQNPLINENIFHYERNYTDISRKFNLFHNLKFRWTLDKFFCHYFLWKHGVLTKGFVTYQPPEDVSIETLEQVADAFTGHKRDTMEVIRCLQDFPPMNIDNDKEFNVLKRYHPSYLYDRSYFSFISENFNKTDVEHFYISEKILYPIMQGHPILVSGNQGIHNDLENYGFVMFDELFDLSFDSTEGDCDRIEQSVKEISKFDIGDYENNLKQIVSKIYHNQRNLTNYNSTLWNKLRSRMKINLERIFK